MRNPRGPRHCERGRLGQASTERRRIPFRGRAFGKEPEGGRSVSQETGRAHIALSRASNGRFVCGVLESRSLLLVFVAHPSRAGSSAPGVRPRTTIRKSKNTWSSPPRDSTTRAAPMSEVPASLTIVDRERIEGERRTERAGPPRRGSRRRADRPSRQRRAEDARPAGLRGREGARGLRGRRTRRTIPGTTPWPWSRSRSTRSSGSRSRAGLRPLSPEAAPRPASSASSHAAGTTPAASVSAAGGHLGHAALRRDLRRGFRDVRPVPRRDLRHDRRFQAQRRRRSDATQRDRSVRLGRRPTTLALGALVESRLREPRARSRRRIRAGPRRKTSTTSSTTPTTVAAPGRAELPGRRRRRILAGGEPRLPRRACEDTDDRPRGSVVRRVLSRLGGGTWTSTVQATRDLGSR